MEPYQVAGRLPFSPSFRRIVAILAIALGLFSIVSRVRFSLSPHGVTNDFTQDYVAARAWSDGLDPYEPTAELVRRSLGSNVSNFDIAPLNQRTPHPPAMILLVRLVSWLPYRAARVTWLLATGLITAFALGWFALLLGASRRTAMVVAVASLSIPVVQTDLVYGQSNGLLLALLVTAWWALRNEKDTEGGIALGLAAALKLFPAFMILPLFRRRRFRAAIWQIVSAVGISVIAAGFVGFNTTWEFIRRVSPENVRFWRAAPINLSILAIPYRWLTLSIWRPNAINLPIVAGLLALLLLACLIVLALRGSSAITGDQFWETIPLMLLAVPTLWETYLVLTIPLSFLVVRRVLRGEPVASRWVILVSLAIVSIGLWPGLPPILHTSAAAQVFEFSWPFYGLLAIALVGGLRRQSIDPALTARL